MVKQSAQPSAAMQILLFQGISVLLKLQDFCFPGFFPAEADALVQRADIRKGTGGGIQPSGGAFPISGQGFPGFQAQILHFAQQQDLAHPVFQFPSGIQTAVGTSPECSAAEEEQRKKQEKSCDEQDCLQKMNQQSAALL